MRKIFNIKCVYLRKLKKKKKNSNIIRKEKKEKFVIKREKLNRKQTYNRDD